MLNKIGLIYLSIKNKGFRHLFRSHILQNIFKILNFGPRYIFLRNIELCLPRPHRHKYTLPSYLQLESTSRCNMKCRNCARDTLSCFGDLSLNNFFHVIKQFPFLKEVKLQGLGEPLLNDSLFDMAGFLKKKRIITYIATNGTLITKDNASDMIRYFDKIEISIDSPDGPSLKDIRGNDCIDDVLRGARLLKSINGESNIAINFVMEKRNIDDLKGMVRLAHDLNITHINVVSLQNWFGAGSKHGSRRSEISGRSIGKDVAVDNKLKEAMRSARSFGVYLDFSRPASQKGSCFWYKRGVYVSWNGYVTPCCIRPNYEEFSFGNVFEENIRGIWNSQNYIRFREELSAGRIPVICKGCSYV